MTSKEREQYVNYRFESAYRTVKAARMLGDNGFWNSAVNRLYYAAFYAVNALLVKNEIHARSHSGVKNQFSLHFIKTRRLGVEYGRLFSELFDWRQKGDYENLFDFDEVSVSPLFDQVEDFIRIVEHEANSSSEQG